MVGGRGLLFRKFNHKRICGLAIRGRLQYWKLSLLMNSICIAASSCKAHSWFSDFNIYVSLSTNDVTNIAALQLCFNALRRVTWVELNPSGCPQGRVIQALFDSLINSPLCAQTALPAPQCPCGLLWSSAVAPPWLHLQFHLGFTCHDLGSASSASLHQTQGGTSSVWTRELFYLW